MSNILEALIHASERAACVARACAASLNEENLVVAEKFGSEANSRFEQDFKTIADVLAQEAAKTEIARRVKELGSSVWGEECGEINGVTIKVQESLEDTALLLSSLVPQDTAVNLAKGSHCDLHPNIYDKIPTDLPPLDGSNLGVWIDPIDATSEFITGVNDKTKNNETSGLPCVTVLIGAYMKSTGEPVIGVVNQPFYDNGKGRIAWGLCYEGIQKLGGCKFSDINKNNLVLVSAAEASNHVENFRIHGWDVKSIPGCGHKLLKVALGEAAAYVVSKGTTFVWDTCAVHAIIKARGGEVISYSSLTPITYSDKGQNDHCNSEGIIAYCQPMVLHGVKNVLGKT